MGLLNQGVYEPANRPRLACFHGEHRRVRFTRLVVTRKCLKVSRPRFGIKSGVWNCLASTLTSSCFQQRSNATASLSNMTMASVGIRKRIYPVIFSNLIIIFETGMRLIFTTIRDHVISSERLRAWCAKVLDIYDRTTWTFNRRDELTLSDICIDLSILPRTVKMWFSVLCCLTVVCFGWWLIARFMKLYLISSRKTWILVITATFPQ